MCKVHYLGTEHEVVTDKKEAEAFKRFHVLKLEDRSKKPAHVVALSEYPYIVYLGSSGECGCSFDSNETDDYQKLADYAKKLPSQNIAVYCCWEGDEALPKELERTCTISDLESPEFFMQEKELVTIKNSKKEQK